MEKVDPCALLVGMETVHLLCEESAVNKLNTELSYDLAIPLVDIYLQRTASSA